MKGRLAVVSCLLVLVVSLCACRATTAMSYTFNVSTGDKVEVELDTSESGLKLKQEDGRFSIERDGKTVAYGAFGQAEDWDYYKEIIGLDEYAKMISENDTRLVWMEYASGGPEYDMVEKVSDKTCVFVGNTIDEENTEGALQEVFDRLLFRLSE